MKFENFIGLSFIFVFGIVHYILRIKNIKYNADNIAIALILGGFAGCFILLLLNLFINPIFSLIISSIILAFIYIKILLT